MSYIVFDLELNQHYELSHRPVSIPVPECPFEIIQIGAVRLDEKFNILDQFEILIRPQIYIHMHPYVEKITGLTEIQLNAGVSFPSAADAFIDFTGWNEAEPPIFCVWGGSDMANYYKNMVYYHLCMPKPLRFINVQLLASQYLKRPHGIQIGLQNAVDSLMIEKSVFFHNALNDAIYTAKVFQIVNKPNMQIQVFKPK